MNKKRGFTLIELLVVVAIIGILASLSLASLTKVKRDARNKRRMSDILQIMTALNLYNDGYQSYPIDNNDGGDSDYSHLPLVGPDFISGLEPDYLSKTPLDPLQDSGTPNLVYKYTSDDGSTFILQFNMEPSGQGTDCPGNAPNESGWCTIRP